MISTLSEQHLERGYVGLLLLSVLGRLSVSDLIDFSSDWSLINDIAVMKAITAPDRRIPSLAVT